jgi:hypothetical protein
MEGYVPINDMALLYEDLTATLLALANALDAKGVLTKAEFASFAQERLLVLRRSPVLEGPGRFAILQMLATDLEGRQQD